MLVTSQTIVHNSPKKFKTDKNYSKLASSEMPWDENIAGGTYRCCRIPVCYSHWKSGFVVSCWENHCVEKR